VIRGIYQGWTGWRNLGDEAMLQSCRRALPHLEWTARPPFDACATLPPAARLRASWGRCMERLVGTGPALLGGGTLINRAPEWLDEYRRLRRAARRPVPIFSPGVANPAYWSGKPGWRDTRSGWRDALADLPEVGVRGPLSRSLLEEAGIRNVSVTGDPALIFYRGPRPQADGRRRIAMNAGRSGGEMWGSEDRLIAVLADSGRRLASLGFDVRVFPVWDRDEPVCHEVAGAAGLPPESVDPLILDPEAFIEYLDRFDVVVAVKLHAAVLAAAAGVPFVAVEYRPKVRDFAESIGCASQVFRSSQIDGNGLTRAVLDLYGDLAATRTRLQARVVELSETFRAYAGRVEQVLLS
jgi:polysaccharide pyruvyl transferase WcaK-like protein